jgi:hypothetical protein
MIFALIGGSKLIYVLNPNPSKQNEAMIRMNPILHGSNSPAVTAHPDLSSSISASAKEKAKPKDACTITELSELALFRLSMDEPEPVKCLPTSLGSPKQHRRHVPSPLQFMDDADLFRRSMEEPEPKKCLPTQPSPPTNYAIDRQRDLADCDYE